MYEAIILGRVIDSARCPRAAPKHAPSGQHAAARRAQLTNRLFGIRGAGGVEAAATTDELSDRNAVQADQAEQPETNGSPKGSQEAPLAHAVTPAATNARFMSAITSCVLAPWISGRATNTMSNGPCTRAASVR